MYQIETVTTETNITSDLITLNVGNSSIKVYTHGSTNTFHNNGEDVTAQRPLEIQLVKFFEVYKQRGGNPFMGPMAGRYGDSEGQINETPQRIAQPGLVDIHGLFAGLPWDISEINDQKGYVQLELPAVRWKNELKNYYYFAASKPKKLIEERASLERLINATLRRYDSDQNVIAKISELKSLLNNNTQSTKYLKKLTDLIDDLVNFAYPGEANVTRRITLESIDENTTSFLDEVWLTNVSDKENDYYRDASGFHPYFNTLLSEIIMPDNFWENGIVPLVYDDNLPDVRVRELNQFKRLGRRMYISPEGELRSPNANQIIYKDPNTVGVAEVAIENWRQKGDAFGYPEKARIILPGETSHIGFRTIVIIGDQIPDSVRKYIGEVNEEIGVEM